MSWAEIEFGDVLTANKMTVTKFSSEDVKPRVQLGMKTKKNQQFFFLFLGVLDDISKYTEKEFEERMNAAGWVRSKGTVVSGGKKETSQPGTDTPLTDGQAGTNPQPNAGTKVPDGGGNQKIRPQRKTRTSS